jgi:hypothetical protein
MTVEDSSENPSGRREYSPSAPMSFGGAVGEAAEEKTGFTQIGNVEDAGWGSANLELTGLTRFCFSNSCDDGCGWKISCTCSRICMTFLIDLLGKKVARERVTMYGVRQSTTESPCTGQQKQMGTNVMFACPNYLYHQHREFQGPCDRRPRIAN